MPRKVNLTGIGGWVNLKTKGITIHVEDERNNDCCGRLRVGKRVYWKPAGKQIERSKSWEELIIFFMSAT